jgi:galactoside O-acetyltransferase
MDAACETVPGNFGVRIRRWWIGFRLAKNGGALTLGRRCVVDSPENMFFDTSVSFGNDCHLTASKARLTIGAHSSFNRNVFIGADYGEIEIGRDVLVAMNVVFRASNHRYDQIPAVAIRLQGHLPGKIRLGDDVWIGANVTLVAGSSVGSHSVIAAGSVVTGEIPPYSLAGGIPARVIRSLAKN